MSLQDATKRRNWGPSVYLHEGGRRSTRAASEGEWYVLQWHVECTLLCS